jgi:photosystem II stability/assembly factor-like uncharacterized protein
MAKRRFFSLSTALVFGALLLMASPSHAQWTLLKTFPAAINSVYFLDQQGSPTTGFVGLENSTIFRTTDNGVTWNLATTPQTAFSVVITDFTFRNAMQGWCSVEGYFNEFEGSIWETTDGGQTWNSVYSIAGSVVSIGFCSASNELIAPCWNIKSVCSSDFGDTWTEFAPQQQNGVTFSGSLGFVSIFSTLLNSLYSTDGGLTWDNAPSLNAEAWSPYGIPGTSTFVAVAEKSNQFFISTNGGASWANPYSFPADETPVGCIMGTTTSLLVQTTNSGFYWSDDTGKTWVSICGPENYRDTRFYSVGSQVFAGDGNPEGNLWYLANATGGVTLHLNKTTLVFSGNRCVTTDTIIHIGSSSGCVNGVLTTAQILSGAPAFSLGGVPTNLSGNDSITVYYTPSLAPEDSGILLLQFNLGTRTIDTIVTLYGTSRNTGANFSIAPSMVLSIPYACLTKDSVLILRNLACDSLTITGVSVSDSSHFQILPLLLPRVIAPAGFDTIPITSFSLLDGTFTSELELHMIAGGSEAVNDTVPLTLKVLQGGHAEIGTLNLSVLDECTSIDTEVSILTTPCDSIVLMEASLSDTSVFQLGAISLPTVIPASGADSIRLHVSPGPEGNYSTLLKFRYLSGSETVDTTITLKLKVQYNLPVKVVLQDTLFEMGTLNAPCSSSSRWITFSNPLCRDLTIKNIMWENADSDFTFDPASFPITLSSDSGIDSILVHFKPNTADTLSNRLQITLDLGGLVVDTEITISGVGISLFHDTLLTPMLSYDTVSACQSKTLEGEIVNLSCDDVIATSAMLALGINYSVVSPAFPASLPPGDTLHVLIQLQPKQNDNVTDSAQITIYDPVDSSDHIQRIFLNGYVIPSSHLLTLNSTSFSLGSISPCSFVDSAIVLTNNGNCDDVIITDTSVAGYLGVTFVPPLVLPLVIPPDSTVRIAFRVASNEDTAASTQFILNGQNIDTTIVFSYASLPGGNALAFSAPDSVFVTRPCMQVSKTFWIANVGCYGTSVDTITLTLPPNETQFTLGSLPGFPSLLAPGDTLYYTVQFDPNGSGDGVALLDVRADQIHYNSSIGLTGSVIGMIPTARVAMEASDRTLQSSGVASDTTSIAAVLLDDIGDTTGLETVTFTLNANWNLLTLTNIVPAVGWSVADTVTMPNGSLDLRLRHDAGGAVAAGTELVNCYFAIAVTDSTGCDISMSGLRFNDSSSNYDGCVLSSIEMQGSVRFSFIDTCGTPLLRELLEGEVAIAIISVRPNPVPLLGGAERLELCIALAQPGTVTIELSDMLGREAWQSIVPCLAGTQTLPLELPNIPEGNYVIEVSSAGMKDSRNVVFEGGFGKN